MRIVAGEFRGRHLASPTTNAIRPTTDRVRESLFAILQAKYSDLLQNAKVLDLFAGTGALGIEAVSRGANQALLVDNSVEAKKLISSNIDQLQLKKRVRLKQGDAVDLSGISNDGPFDIVFVDPPYGKGFAEKSALRLIALGLINKRGLLVIEDRAAAPPPFLPSYNLLDERSFGDTKLRFMRPG